MAALSWQPDPWWTFDLYVDYERLAGNFDRSSWQVFAGYQTPRLRWGAQYSAQDRERDPTLELASAFVVGQASDRIGLIARLDRIIEPSPAGDNIAYLPFDPSAPATMLLAGVEFRPTRHLTVTPNIVSTWYDRAEDGSRPTRDLHWRITAFFNFE
jgi:hypothetical protein